MIGRLDMCVLITLRVKAASVREFLPRPLELVTLEAKGEEWAFVNVVLCHVQKMRPAWAPGAMGISHHQAAYRLLVKAKKRDGSEQRGLFFLRSFADSKLVCRFGNALTDFKLHRAKFKMSGGEQVGLRWACEVDGEAGATCRVRGRVVEAKDVPVDRESVFRHAEQARGFLKYTPVGMCPDISGRIMRLTEVIRNEDHWIEHPMTLEECRFEYLASIGVENARVEQAVSVEPIAYRWRIGRTAGLAVKDE